jgi:hypothetical protein
MYRSKEFKMTTLGKKNLMQSRRKRLTVDVVNDITIMRSGLPTSFVTTIRMSALRAGFCHGRRCKGAVDVAEVGKLTGNRYRETVEQCWKQPPAACVTPNCSIEAI